MKLLYQFLAFLLGSTFFTVGIEFITKTGNFEKPRRRTFWVVVTIISGVVLFVTFVSCLYDLMVMS